MEQTYYFTFGPDHTLRGESLGRRYVAIPGDVEQSRAEMLARFGRGWCHQYSDREPIERMGLVELPADQWPENPAPRDPYNDPEIRDQFAELLNHPRAELVDMVRHPAAGVHVFGHVERWRKDEMVWSILRARHAELFAAWDVHQHRQRLAQRGESWSGRALVELFGIEQ